MASFPLFSQLPPELRLRIWELALPAQRLITVHLLDFSVRETAETKEYTDDDGLTTTEEWTIRDKVQPDEDIDFFGPKHDGASPDSQDGTPNLLPTSKLFYTLHFPNIHSDPAVLFRVNKEAASVAAARYRLCLRYRPTTYSSTANPGVPKHRRTAVLPLDPETDILFVDYCAAGSGDITDPLLCLISDCLAYDPRRLGLAHFALRAEDRGHMFGGARNDGTLPQSALLASVTRVPRAAAQAKEAVYNLETLSRVLHAQRDAGFQPRSGTRPAVMDHHNVALPIWADTVALEAAPAPLPGGADARPVGRDWEQIVLPEGLACLPTTMSDWLDRYLEIDRGPDEDRGGRGRFAKRFIVAEDPGRLRDHLRRHVDGRVGCEGHLASYAHAQAAARDRRIADEIRREERQQNGDNYRGRTIYSRHEELERRSTLPPVAGFWIWSPEALEHAEMRVSFVPVDMAARARPQLMRFSLAGECRADARGVCGFARAGCEALARSTRNDAEEEEDESWDMMGLNLY
ncbi:hypothetical protein Micbo1qcDRAFT_206283 [Microdochium bolleyi]|uniref:2EXR domain-containing protein n=1 Tax=Microdochium bolleyi TaxID=196109 RepID=A0A136IX66_9PEZI|nr:hypothetical protein Micbo1qcDRAFT_206283 [Microdochium bolleyi]